LETNGAGAFYARACLDVPYTPFRFTEADEGVPRTALARACARPTPAGQASALRFLALGATPSVSFPVDAAEDGSWRKKKEAPVCTAAHVAARSNNARVLTRMLELDSAGVVSARDGEGYPALHVAVVARAAEAAEALLNGGADPAIQIRARVFSTRRNPPSRDDTNDDDDERPTSTATSFVALNAFELAARSGDARVVDAVFGAGGTNEKKNGALKKNGSEESLAAALFAAARVGNSRAANLAAARVVAGDFLGDDPGSSVRRNPDDPEGTNRLARFVLFTRNHLNKTVLETAAGRGAAEVIRVLLERAASPTRRTPRRGGDDGAGAMAWAAYARSDEAIEAVLAAGFTARDEWAAACRVAETRGASMRARRVLRGRASGT
jgi:ankyrin repeat protein